MTPPDLNIATSQEVYNYVITFLRKQGVQAKSLDSGFCRYLTEDGNKCAVGCLFPEGFYKKHFEGINLEDLIENFPDDFMSAGFDLHLQLLGNLQYFHDNAAVWLRGEETFNEHAKQLAESFALTYLPRKPANV
jgi:hypothetical protein